MLAWCCFGSVACGEATKSAVGPRPNVIVVLVDTLRAENLGGYGYGRATSPTLDALARDDGSTLFLEARAQAPCTFPSANSILTGRPPVDFLGQPDGAMGIPEQIPTLASMLSAEGYTTAAISTSPIVRATPSRVNQRGGFGAGFDSFDEDCEWRPAGCVSNRALELANQLAEPFFMYLHYFDPHGPYRPPPHWQRQFADGEFQGQNDVLRGDPMPFSRRMYDDGLDSGLSADELAHFVDLYDDEIAFFDHSFGNLLASWRARGLLDRSILVVLSDHGEHFLEHGHLKHCRSLYDVEIKTPLLIRFPASAGQALRRAQSIDRPVGNLAVAPTILDALGIDPSQRGFAATSLLPLIKDPTAEVEPVVASWGALRAIRLGKHKLIQDLATGAYELYDIETDPAEQHDIATQAPEVAQQLRRALSNWLREHEGDSAGRHAGDEVARQLRALGYL